MSEAVLELQAVSRWFAQGEGRLVVLDNVSLELTTGETVALIGPSGAGKSTLLHTAGLLERPEAGEVRIAGQSFTAAGDRERTRARRHHIGFVYQFHHLLPEFTALENVAVPLRIAGKTARAALPRAQELLEAMGLGDRLEHVPAKLSGGEQQRVAIARALANGPKLLLADEPTGNLDHATAAVVFDELLALARDHGLAALIATHNDTLAARMDRVMRLDAGHVVAA